MKKRIESQNFFVSLVTLLLLAFEANQLTVNVSAEQVVSVFASQDAGAIISLIFLNFLNPVMKILSKAQEWSWEFLKSANFWTQVVTVALAGVAIFGLQFPEGAAPELVEAYYSKQFSIISVAIVVNLINPIYHFLKKKPDATE
jgi:nitrous oxidase accessory protein NosD